MGSGGHGGWACVRGRSLLGVPPADRGGHGIANDLLLGLNGGGLRLRSHQSRLGATLTPTLDMPLRRHRILSSGVFETAALGQTRRPYRNLVYRGGFTTPLGKELLEQLAGLLGPIS